LAIGKDSLEAIHVALFNIFGELYTFSRTGDPDIIRSECLEGQEDHWIREMDAAVEALRGSDNNRTIGLAEPLAVRGLIWAQYTIGSLYAMVRRPEETLKWMLRAAEQGSPHACNYLVMLYSSRSSPDQELAEYFRRRADEYGWQHEWLSLHRKPDQR